MNVRYAVSISAVAAQLGAGAAPAAAGLAPRSHGQDFTANRKLDFRMQGLRRTDCRHAERVLFICRPWLKRGEILMIPSYIGGMTIMG